MLSNFAAISSESSLVGKIFLRISGICSINMHESETSADNVYLLAKDIHFTVNIRIKKLAENALFVKPTIPRLFKINYANMLFIFCTNLINTYKLLYRKSTPSAFCTFIHLNNQKPVIALH